jgi:FkbM family methyltransferase
MNDDGTPCTLVSWRSKSICASAERLGRFAVRYWRGNARERTALRRKSFFDISRAMTPLLGVDAPEGTLLVRTDDIDLGRGTFADGPWDQDMVDFAICELESNAGTHVEGGIVIEIGANIGTTTLLLLNRYKADRVIAFEPIPQSARMLRAMLALNGLELRVDLRERALTNRDAALEMELSQRSPGDNRVRTRPPQGSRQGEADRSVVGVRGARLDVEVPDLRDVALVWMDAQGHEGHVPVITEFWPYGLRRAGGLEMFLGAITEHYARVFDTAHGDAAHARMHQASEIEALADKYRGPADFTDLILLKR